MSTLANRHNHSAPMSDSDHDDDYEQNSSVNQQNESMMHKVKDVVSKLLHPSFLFSAGGDTSRPKRKRTISVEENGEEKQAEVPASTTNGHGPTGKSKQHRRAIVADDEPQLTDDEDNTARDVSPNESDLPDLEQSKKRRRTANYQHIVSTSTATATANGHHQDERTSPPSISTTSVGSSVTRRVLDYGPNTANTTPVLLQTSTETSQNEGINRFASAKPRFNLPSTHRALPSQYDPSQSPLFSVGSRKTTETTMSPNRTTTNLKSQSNEFSANYLLATGLANRVQPNASLNHSQLSSSTLTNPAANHTQRLVSAERQMLGVNYASINSRRLPYIERLRRRTLQDCIRLNRTLDSEPLSISTIEEHTSTTASPIRKPSKVPEKECGIQCNISTTDSSMEPSRKIQRTFPPADIRDEALSVPTTLDKVQTTSQTDSSIQSKSSITFELIKPTTNDITKPKVIGNITAFSWPKFARAQDDYAKKHPEKCRADAIPAPTSKACIPSTVEKSTASSISFGNQPASTSLKTSIFDASPPRLVKTGAGPLWKCPSCTTEHPAQTASCSLCHGINPNYKRLSTIESAPIVEKPTTSIRLPAIIVEEPVVATSSTSTLMSIPTTSTVASAPITTAPTVTFSLPTSTKENPFSMPAASTTAPSFAVASTTPSFGTISATPSFGATNTMPSFGTTSSITPSFGITPLVSLPTSTKESTITAPPVVTTASLFPAFPSSAATPAFGITATSATLNPFSTGTSGTSTFPSFGAAAASASGIATPAASTTTSVSAPSISVPIVFGSFANPLTTTSTASPATATSIPSITSTAASDKPLPFAFGTSSSAPSLTALAASTAPPPISTAVTSTAAVSFMSNPFSFSAAPATSASTLSSNPLPTAPSSVGFPFGSGFPSAPSLSATATTTNAAAATTAPSLFGSGFGSASSSSSSGFTFPSAGAATTTTTSASAPFGFGAASPPRTFAPPVVSLGTAGSMPAFGSLATFGAPTTSASSFSSFGSSAAPSFAFGAPPASNPLQTSATSTGSTGGFAFSSAPSSVAAPGAVFGATPQPFSFSAPTSFSFGAGAPSAPVGNTPFQFGSAAAATGLGGAIAQPSSLLVNPMAPAMLGAPDANPFSVSDDAASRRPMVKAKRRGKP